MQRLAVAFAAAVDQSSAALLEPVHGKWGPGAIAQQTLQPCAVCCLNAHPGIDREATAVSIGGHVFGVMRIQVPACDEGAQDAFAHVGLHFAKSGLVKSSGRVKSHTVWQRLKHPIDHAHMKVHMRVQAGAKAVDESDRAQVQAGGVCLCSAGAMGLQTLLHHAQEDAQFGIERALVALQVVAQAFGHRQYPLAHHGVTKHALSKL